MQRFLRLEPGGDAGTSAAIQRLQGEQHRRVGIALDHHPRGGGKAPGLIGGCQLVGEALGIVALDEGESGQAGDDHQSRSAARSAGGCARGSAAGASLRRGDAPLRRLAPGLAGRRWHRGWPARRDPARGRSGPPRRRAGRAGSRSTGSRGLGRPPAIRRRLRRGAAAGGGRRGCRRSSPRSRSHSASSASWAISTVGPRVTGSRSKLSRRWRPKESSTTSTAGLARARAAPGAAPGVARPRSPRPA